MSKLRCAACRSTDARYVEDIPCARRVLSVTVEGVVQIDAAYTTDKRDGDPTNKRYVCNNCGHSAPIGCWPRLEFVPA